MKHNSETRWKWPLNKGKEDALRAERTCKWGSVVLRGASSGLRQWFSAGSRNISFLETRFFAMMLAWIQRAPEHLPLNIYKSPHWCTRIQGNQRFSVVKGAFRIWSSCPVFAISSYFDGVKGKTSTDSIAHLPFVCFQPQHCIARQEMVGFIDSSVGYTDAHKQLKLIKTLNGISARFAKHCKGIKTQLDLPASSMYFSSSTHQPCVGGGVRGGGSQEPIQQALHL